VDAAYLSQLARTGGFDLWSDAVTDLARWLDARGVRRPIAFGPGLSDNLYVLTEGRVDPEDAFMFAKRAAPALVRARWKEELADPSPRLLVPAEGVDPMRSGKARRKLKNALAASGRHLVVEKAFTDRAGAPVYFLCSARPDRALAGREPLKARSRTP
jgi:hypothetical protein